MLNYTWSSHSEEGVGGRERIFQAGVMASGGGESGTARHFSLFLSSSFSDRAPPPNES